MLRCTYELVPFGDESRKQVIGCIEIANDGKGDAITGNYIALIQTKAPFGDNLKNVILDGGKPNGIMVSIKDYPRRLRAYELLRRVLNQGAKDLTFTE